MAITKRFVVKKDETTEEISYFEYDKKIGFDFNPKNTNIDDMINVNKMVIINPSLIKKLVDKKCQRTLKKILKMTVLIYETEDSNDDGTGKLGFVLDEIEKFKQLILSKYKDYMEAKEYKLMMKKLEIIENEVKLRRVALKTKEEKKENKKNKGR